MKRIIIGITGATGTIYGWRLMELLRSEGETEIHLVMSQSAKLTLKMEHDVELDYIQSLAHEVHQAGNIGASISSGSFHSEGMIIAPCSIKTMSNIAMGNTGDLISRAADVILKERRRLVVAIRETPLHAGHLESLIKLANLGAVIFPPVPAFYNRPATLLDIVDQSCMRMLDQLDINVESAPRWGEQGGVPAVGQSIEGGKAKSKSGE
ncbi:MAG: UbiX family flavin prenyltransferase [Rhodospirillaceae bacterium]|jgi:4-hydroxy-3-polyprenylbenzoate decarboxylase|nr:UbiX family flavin prenyltransferase [Rhodospirillaceae bacterium]MBT5459432.1 UbiX family flavin prenyltransferase [Rhodospirillaceae bacterium]